MKTPHTRETLTHDLRNLGVELEEIHSLFTPPLRVLEPSKGAQEP